MRRAGTSTSISSPCFHEGKRAADETLGRHVQNAGAVAGAAHARIGNTQHVAHALRHQLLRNRQHAPLRHARPALRTAVLEHENVVGRDVEVVTFDLACHVVVVLEGDHLAVVSRSRFSAADGFITQPRGARLPVSTAVAPSRDTGSPKRMDHIALVDLGARDVLADASSGHRQAGQIERALEPAHQGTQSTGVEEVLHQEFSGWPYIGEHRDLREISSNRFMSSVMPRGAPSPPRG